MDDVLGARIEDRVDRVEPQPVEAEVPDPALRRLQHPLAHRVALGVVVVHRTPPGRLVLRREVRAEGVERRAPGGADVVVDDVQNHGEAHLVGGVDQRLESCRAAIGGLRRAQIDAVVAPAPAAGEFGHRHDLDRGHTQFGQRRQVADRAGEAALVAEGADVQLVDHLLGQRPGCERAPALRGRKRAMAHAARAAASAMPDREAGGCRSGSSSRFPEGPRRQPHRSHSRRAPAGARRREHGLTSYRDGQDRGSASAARRVAPRRGIRCVRLRAAGRPADAPTGTRSTLGYQPECGERRKRDLG